MRQPGVIVAAVVMVALPVTGQPGKKAKVALAQEKRAAEELRAMAAQGDPKAQVKLGFLYADGKGVPKDMGEALRWWKKSAAQENPEAQAVLGYAYHFGQGVPQDFVEAVKWYKKAASHGDPGSQFGLGLCYAKGQGVPKDFAEAYVWYNLAVANEEPKAAKARDEVARVLSAHAITQAQAKARKIQAEIQAWKSEQ